MSFLTKEKANALISSIARRGATLTNDIQKAAVTAIGYSIMHGDITIGQKLVAAVKPLKSVRTNSLVAYMEQHGNFQWDKDAKDLVYRKNEEAITDPVELVKVLAELPWTDAVPEKEIESVVDVDAKLAKFVKSLLKQIAEVEQAGGVVKNKEHLAVLQAVASGEFEVAVEE